MDGFHKIVLVFAVSFLLLILITVGIMMPRKDPDAPWPPIAGRCPDGWMEDVTVNNKCEISETNKGQFTYGTATAKRDANNGTSTLTATSPNVFRDVKRGDGFKIVTWDWGANRDLEKATVIGTYMVDRVDRSGKTLVLKNTNAQVDGSVIYIQSAVLFDGKTVCDKKSWASRWGVHWDGVSNYNKCP
jgi:hypothetical protein